MTEREREILERIRQDPLIPQQALADQLGISRSAVAGHIMNLMQKGLIIGKGYVLAQKSYAVVIGGANMDIAGSTTSALRFSDSNPGTVRSTPGGVARNIAENLARLGCDCRLISAFGDDAHGRMLIESTRAAGVDLSPSLILPDAATSTYLSVHGPDGDMAIAVNDMGILDRLTPERLAPQRDLLRHAALIVADTNLGEDALAWIFANRGDRPVFVDTVSAFKAERIRPWLSHIHTLKPNRLEASQLSGLPFDSREQAPAVADWFHRAGVNQIILSGGANGLYYSNGITRGWMNPPHVDIVSAEGAGDALMAGLAYGCLQQHTLTESVRFALGCAALTLTSDKNNHPALSQAVVDSLLTKCLA
ncbi:PfkB family carbohydrate kinase [Paludibacterium yongneupense]|uniref:PfkB family carbohydrate kinase n=1 Tax=Paludibacterium yongneupense TaxID=400061 RepID=UPI00048E27EF|nr:PfkB family carbohydrate kinase [Paludibacterium yongneupense]